MILSQLAAPLMASLAIGVEDPDAVVSTAPRGAQSVVVGAEAPQPDDATQTRAPHGLTTAQQIDQWVAARAPGERPFNSSRDPFAFEDDRKMHGEVSAGIGTGDYSAFGATVSLPIGENGRLNLSYSQSRNNPWIGGPWGYGTGGYGIGGYGYGYDPRFGRVYDPFGIGMGIVEPGAPAWLRQRLRTPEDRIPARSSTIAQDESPPVR